jgi:hypothetical protein
VAIAVLMTAVASGCESGTGDAYDRDEPSTPAAPPADQPGDPGQPARTSKGPADPEARSSLRSAIISLLRANTGQFEVTIPFGDGVTISETGRYRIEPLAYESVRIQESPEATLRLATRAVGDEQWIRLESLTSQQGDDGAWPCWVSYDDIAAFPDFPVALSQGPGGQPPAAVVSATYGIGRQQLGVDSLAGTTDLALALGLVSSKFLLSTGIDPQGDATAPATFSLDDRTLAEVAVPLADIPTAVEAAGGSLPPELDALSQAPGAIVTRFTDVGSSVAISRPNREVTLELSEGDDYETAMRSCGDG